MTNYNPSYISDVSGQVPIQNVAGAVRNLTPNQIAMLVAYPIIAATNKLVWQVVAHRSELNTNGCLLVARVLYAGSRAIEQVRSNVHNIAVDAQLIAARISLVARELSIDLTYGAQSAIGNTDAFLPQPDLLTLQQFEAIDPILTPIASVATAYQNFQAVVTPIINDLTFQVVSS